MATDAAYDEGKDLGQFMKAERDDGRFDYDCRYDLADAAKRPGDYFVEFKRGLEDGLRKE